MVVHESVAAHTIAKRLAEELCDETDVRELWLHEMPELVDLWLITGSIDDETELRLYGKSGSLFDAFPARRLRLHVLHPSMFAEGTDMRSLVARGSTHIRLQP
ncbi:MAG: hypothetical protein M3439_11350 [Chloroflexota bacterium]|nr:hypothetical protein [Chloroflexota bacterium]